MEYTTEFATISINCTLDEANCTEEQYLPYSDRPETYILPFVFLFILLVGVTGNGVLVLTILRHANMRNVPNTYVLSLALGDLLVNIYLTIILINFLNHCLSGKCT